MAKVSASRRGVLVVNDELIMEMDNLREVIWEKMLVTKIGTDPCKCQASFYGVSEYFDEVEVNSLGLPKYDLVPGEVTGYVIIRRKENA